MGRKRKKKRSQTGSSAPTSKPDDQHQPVSKAEQGTLADAPSGSVPSSTIAVLTSGAVLQTATPADLGSASSQSASTLSQLVDSDMKTDMESVTNTDGDDEVSQQMPGSASANAQQDQPSAPYGDADSDDVEHSTANDDTLVVAKKAALVDDHYRIDVEHKSAAPPILGLADTNVINTAREVGIVRKEDHLDDSRDDVDFHGDDDVDAPLLPSVGGTRPFEASPSLRLYFHHAWPLYYRNCCSFTLLCILAFLLLTVLDWSVAMAWGPIKEQDASHEWLGFAFDDPPSALADLLEDEVEEDDKDIPTVGPAALSSPRAWLLTGSIVLVRLAFYPLFAGFAAATLRAWRRRSKLLHIGEVFSQYTPDQLPRVMGLGLVVLIAHCLGTSAQMWDELDDFSVIPVTIYVWFFLATYFAVLLVVDDGHGLRRSQRTDNEASSRTVFGALGANLSFARHEGLAYWKVVIALFLVQWLGVLALAVGVFFTFPLAVCALCVCYDRYVRPRIRRQEM